MTLVSASSDPAGFTAPANHTDNGLLIQTGDAELRDLPAGTPPPLDNAIWHGSKQPGGPLTIIYHRDALAIIQEHGLENSRVEVGGVLLGHVYRHQDQQVILEIFAALPAHTADHGPYHFTFTADAWAQIHQERAVQYPHLDILGWFHTHPDLGVFYSADDVVVHTAAFTMAWHVGLVVDPINNEVAHFGWANGEIVPLPGFFELLPAGEMSIIPWQHVRTAVWRDTYEAHLAAQSRQRNKSLSIGGVSIPADAVPLIAGALVVLAAFLLMVGMLFISNQRINRLERIANDLFAENLDAAAAAGLANCPLETVRILEPYPGQVITEIENISVFGVAREPGSPLYSILVSSEETGEQTVLNEIRRGLGNNTRVLARWDTSEFPAGTYILDLVGLNRDGTLYQSGNARCSIAVTLER